MKLNIMIHLNRYLFLLIFCIINVSSFAKDDLKSLSDFLDYVIDNKQLFTEQKEIEINSLKSLLSSNHFSLEYEYEINQKLYDQYKKFKLDSAMYYTERNVQIANALEDRKLVYDSSLQLAVLYSSSGMYRESEEILKSINTHELPDELLPDYYEAYSRFFEHYGQTSSQGKYMQQTEMYRDSLIGVLNPSSFRYKINLAHRCINQKKLKLAEEILIGLLEKEDADTPGYALITHYLGALHRAKNNPDLERKYFTLSAIADIKNSIKENASFQRLAMICYETGDIAGAFKYTQSAIEDAVFSNVQFRAAQLSKFYSIINASYREQESKSKSQLQLYLILISILSIFLILLVIYVYKQMKKLSGIKEELSLTNSKLIVLNNELNESNERLSEANHIKEQYIAHFFDLCSTYISKMEDYRKNLTKIALSNQFDKLLKILKSTTIVDNEVEELYVNFDSIFLNLYPTFVSDFNSLLEKDEQVVLKSGDLLNKELRIYALLRLGITDSVKIAAFLRCSLSTVYNYRTKMRNKTTVPREEFENIVMKIGVMHKKEE